MAADKELCTLDELLAPAQPCPEELLEVSTFDQDIVRWEADHGMTETLDSVMEQLKSLAWMGQGHGKMSPKFCLMLDSIGPLENNS